MPAPTWVFDSSAIIQIKSAIPFSERPHVFASMARLVNQGRLRFPARVLDELSRHRDHAHEWAKQHASAASEGEPTLGEVKDVLAVVPDIIDPEKDSGVDEADPYVLAMAVRLRASGVDARVVTQETRDFPTKLSLNTAAGVLGIPSVPLRGFLRAEDIS